LDVATGTDIANTRVNGYIELGLIVYNRVKSGSFWPALLGAVCLVLAGNGPFSENKNAAAIWMFAAASVLQFYLLSNP